MESSCWRKIDITRNCYRFYVIRLQTDLFSPWRVECEWGRLGGGNRPQRKVRCFDNLGDARLYRDQEENLRRRRGYHPQMEAAS